MKDSKNLAKEFCFKPEDFTFPSTFHAKSLEEVSALFATMANNKLQKWLAEAPTVYFDGCSPEIYEDYGDFWSTKKTPIDIKKAKLVCIEEIED